MEITDIFIDSFYLECTFHFSNSYFITLKYCLEFLMILILSIAYCLLNFSLEMFYLVVCVWLKL